MVAKSLFVFAVDVIDGAISNLLVDIVDNKFVVFPTVVNVETVFCVVIIVVLVFEITAVVVDDFGAVVVDDFGAVVVDGFNAVVVDDFGAVVVDDFDVVVVDVFNVVVVDDFDVVVKIVAGYVVENVVVESVLEKVVVNGILVVVVFSSKEHLKFLIALHLQAFSSNHENKLLNIQLKSTSKMGNVVELVSGTRITFLMNVMKILCLNEK